MTDIQKAPVLVGAIAFADAEGTEPVILYESSGAYTVVMIVNDTFDVKAGVLFGSSVEMEPAAVDNSFPVGSTESVRFRVSPSAPYISVIGLDGAVGQLYYYIEGQTGV